VADLLNLKGRLKQATLSSLFVVLANSIPDLSPRQRPLILATIISIPAAKRALCDRDFEVCFGVSIEGYIEAWVPGCCSECQAVVFPANLRSGSQRSDVDVLHDIGAPPTDPCGHVKQRFLPLRVLVGRGVNAMFSVVIDGSGSLSSSSLGAS
jgi:hypothetical protein